MKHCSSCKCKSKYNSSKNHNNVSYEQQNIPYTNEQQNVPYNNDEPVDNDINNEDIHLPINTNATNSMMLNSDNDIDNQYYASLNYKLNNPSEYIQKKTIPSPILENFETHENNNQIYNSHEYEHEHEHEHEEDSYESNPEPQPSLENFELISNYETFENDEPLNLYIEEFDYNKKLTNDEDFIDEKLFSEF